MTPDFADMIHRFNQFIYITGSVSWQTATTSLQGFFSSSSSSCKGISTILSPQVNSNVIYHRSGHSVKGVGC